MLRMWRPLFTSIGIFLLACGAPLSVCQAQSSDGLLITPLNRTILGRPGGKDSIEFKVSNFLKTRTNIEVGLRDLTQDATGAPVLSDAGSTPQSASKWISVTQGKIALAPGQTQVVRASIAIPPGVSGSYHSALTLQLFASDAPTVPGSSASVVNQAILPIHVFINGTLKPSVELQGATLKTAAGNIASMTDEDELRGKWVLVPRVKNTGNSMVRIKGDVIITSPKGELIGRYQVSGGDPDGQAILPDATVEFPILIDSTLPDAQYPARVSLRFQGAKRIEGYSAPLTLTPRSEGSTAELPTGAVSLGTIERTGLQALVEPSVVIGTVQPNSVRSQRVTVTNLEDFPVMVQANASGLAIDTDGETIALPDSNTANWMTIAPSTFRLGGGQSRVVSVRMNAPSDDQDRWGLLQFEMSSKTPNASTLTATARTTILLRNATNESGGSPVTEKVALTRSALGPIVSVTITNKNQRALAFAASGLQLDENVPTVEPATAPAEVTKTGDAEKTASPPLSFSINGENNLVLLPGASRRLDFQLPANIAAAQYQGVLKLRGLEAAGTAKATNDFSVPFNLNLTIPKPTTATAPTPALAK